MRYFLLILFGLIAVAPPALAQTSSTSPRTLGVQAIEREAARDTDTTAQSRQRPAGQTGAPGSGGVIQDPFAETAAPTNVDVQDRYFPRAVAPFGASLFRGRMHPERSDLLNPGYIITPGDQISVRLYGGKNYEGIGTVDAQGNLFIPEVGPVAVGGLSNARLQDAVRSAVRRVFTDNTDAYVALIGAQPISVLVTGGVVSPGRYSGVASDSALYYLDRAGGVDLNRGSFRDLRILRRGRLVAQFDLYDFLLSGRIPTGQFENGDVILVGTLGPSIAVSGSVQSTARYEFKSPAISGADVMAIARPVARASYVAVSGIRDSRPYNAYIPLSEFQQVSLRDGDEVRFEADNPSPTIFVNIEGQVRGPSTIAVRRGVTLRDLLEHVEIDPRTADASNVYVRRRSTAETQRRALEASLQELQKSVLTQNLATESESQIRVAEADLVERFIQRAKTIVPEGKLVVASDTSVADILLEADDVVVIPAKSDVVVLSGEVVLPQTLAYRPGQHARDYIKAAGGFGQRADTSKIIVMRQSGKVSVGDNPPVLPGDQVLVMPAADTKGFAILQDIVKVIFQVALTTGVVLGL